MTTPFSRHRHRDIDHLLVELRDYPYTKPSPKMTALMIAQAADAIEYMQAHEHRLESLGMTLEEAYIRETKKNEKLSFYFLFTMAMLIAAHVVVEITDHYGFLLPFVVLYIAGALLAEMKFEEKI